MKNKVLPLGFYHSVDTFGAADGRGIRYVLFLSGCKLGCKFCHNPDTWEQGNKTISVENVVNDVKRYRRFYDKSGGGITVSGGEPLLQADFVAALFEHCHHEKIHTTLDTSGYASTAAAHKALIHSDAVLFSIKAAHSLKHQELTGKDNDIIIANLRLAVSLSKVTVRYVVIPGINDHYEDITVLSELIHRLPQSVSIELLPYHTLGRSKWEMLGWDYPLAAIPAAGDHEIEQVKGWLTEQNINVL